jgi:hypothetical protein
MVLAEPNMRYDYGRPRIHDRLDRQAAALAKYYELADLVDSRT